MMTEPMERLLPCPFCGGKAIWEYNRGGQATAFAELQRLQCSECYRIDMPYWDNETDCIEQWNARAPAQSASELLSEATRRAVSAVSKVVSGRDDLGNVHFIELSDAIVTALSSLPSAQCGGNS